MLSTRPVHDRKATLERVNDMSQIAGVRRARLEDGPEDGVSVVDVWTGSGLRFTVVPSRGLDISAAEFRGMSLCPRGHCRESHPASFEAGSHGWQRGFFQGLLTTCGPTFPTEPPAPFELRPANHGRASYTPARNVCVAENWVGDRYALKVAGRMREGGLVWDRTIATELGARWLRIVDHVENESHAPVHHRFQYHINAGYPLVDEGAEFLGSTLGLHARNTGAAIDDAWRTVGAPRADWRGGACDELMVADDEGYSWAAFVNRSLDGGLGYYVRYRIDTLPYFILWKSELPGRYMVGTEPASHIPVHAFSPCNPTGEPLDPLAPGDVRRYDIQIGVLYGAGEIAEFERRAGSTVTNYLDRPDARCLGRTKTGQHGLAP